MMSFFKNLIPLQDRLRTWRQGNWPARIWRLAFFLLLLVYLGQRELQFSIELVSHPSESLQPLSLLEQPTVEEEPQAAGWVGNLANEATAVSADLTEAERKRAAQLSNLGLFLSPGYAERHKIPAQIVAYKRQKCLGYIEKFAATAIEEREQFGIPASITLAQGLLESNAGDSQLAQKEHNHFGIKCRKRCKGCRCANYSDDSRYDMFRIFSSDWRSFREHSKLLQTARYKHLLKLDVSDYRNWAHGLKAAGYATDPQYADKLIQIIEVFELQRFDAS